MLVTFSVGPRQLALPVSQVEEVLRIVAITPLAGAPPFVEGIINRRGVTTPVIDLRKRNGVECGPYDSTTHIVVVSVRGRSTGLIVDEVHDVVESAESFAVIDPSAILTDAEGRELDATRFA